MGTFYGKYLEEKLCIRDRKVKVLREFINGMVKDGRDAPMTSDKFVS
jgi:hypothetical protein